MSNSCLYSHRLDEYTRNSFHSKMLGVIILFMVRGSGTTPIPITSPFAIFTPYNQVVIENRANAVLYQIDTTAYWNALSDLAHLHDNLTEKAKELKISNSDWPQFDSLSNHTHIIIESLSAKLLNTLETLPHPKACSLSRHKRDVEVISTKRGLFQGLGTALSWLTGSLDSEAGSYINLNYNNVKRLQESQGKLIKVLNHTSHKAHENAAKIANIQDNLEALKLGLKSNADKSDLIDKLLITYNDYELSIRQLGTKISDLIQLTQAAVKGNVDQVALEGSLGLKLWNL